MAKYGGWTLGETEAILNVVGGVDVARAVLRGERKLIVEAAPKPQATVLRPPLVGKVWKKIVVPAYTAKDFAEAVRLGNFDNRDSLGNIPRLWGNESVGLEKPAKIDLVEFDRNWWYDEAVVWGEQNKKPLMETAHTMGIAAGLPNEQRERPIVQLCSVQGGRVLDLNGGSDWRGLSRGAVEDGWNRVCVVGFLSE